MIPPALILITRPEPQAERFAALLRQVLGQRAEILVAPVTRTVPIGQTSISADDRVVLTSANALDGVDATSIVGQTAYCVGEATAAAAQKVGFNAITTGSTAEDLIRRLRETRPEPPILYLRGKEVAADIAGILAHDEIEIRQRVTYRQEPMALSQSAHQDINGAKRLIIPLFSANSADHLFRQLPKGRSNTHVVAISANVAKVAKAAGHRSIVIADHPDAASVAQKMKEVLMSAGDDRPDESVPRVREAPKQHHGAPALLGGIGAAVAGFILAQLTPDGWPIASNSARLETIEQGTTAIETRVSDTEESLSDLMGSIAAERDQRSVIAAETDRQMTEQMARQTAQISALADTLTTLDQRLTELERRPAADGSASQAAIRSYDRELVELRAAIDDMNAEIRDLRANPVAAETTTLHLALAELETAAMSGADFSLELAHVATLTATVVPDRLQSASAGISTVSELRAGFPTAARAALLQAHIRGENAKDGSGFGGFIRRQLGLRSLSPREGTDADSILSRAEAALMSGDLDRASQELSALDPEVRAALGPWADQFDGAVSAHQELAIYVENIKNGQE